MSLISKTKLRCPIAMKWSIPESLLREMKDEPGGSFASDSFGASTIPLQFHLKIYPNEDDNNKLNETWIYMFVDYFGEDEITIDYNISVESANFSAAKKFLFTFDDYAGVKFCKTEEFFDPEKRFFVDGKITIKMDGILLVDVEDKAKIWEHNTSDGALCLNLWNQEEDKDVTIHADGKEISNELETFLIAEVDEYSVCCLANCSLLSNSRKLEEKCVELLLECLKESKPVANFDQLDKDFALNLLKNAFYPVSK